MTVPAAKERAAVSSFYAANDTLLYVGITQQFGRLATKPTAARPVRRCTDGAGSAPEHGLIDTGQSTRGR